MMLFFRTPPLLGASLVVLALAAVAAGADVQPEWPQIESSARADVGRLATLLMRRTLYACQQAQSEVATVASDASAKRAKEPYGPWYLLERETGLRVNFQSPSGPPSDASRHVVAVKGSYTGHPAIIGYSIAFDPDTTRPTRFTRWPGGEGIRFDSRGRPREFYVVLNETGERLTTYEAMWDEAGRLVRDNVRRDPALEHSGETKRLRDKVDELWARLRTYDAPQDIDVARVMGVQLQRALHACALAQSEMTAVVASSRGRAKDAKDRRTLQREGVRSRLHVSYQPNTGVMAGATKRVYLDNAMREEHPAAVGFEMEYDAAGKFVTHFRRIPDAESIEFHAEGHVKRFAAPMGATSEYVALWDHAGRLMREEVRERLDPERKASADAAGATAPAPLPAATAATAQPPPEPGVAGSGRDRLLLVVSALCLVAGLALYLALRLR